MGLAEYFMPLIVFHYPPVCDFIKHTEATHTHTIFIETAHFTAGGFGFGAGLIAFHAVFD